MCAGFCCPIAGVVTVSMPNRPMEFNNDFSVCLETSPTTQRVKCMLCKCGDQSVYPQKPHKADAELAAALAVLTHGRRHNSQKLCEPASRASGRERDPTHTGGRQGFTPKVVLWLPQVCFSTCAHIHTYTTHTRDKNYFLSLCILLVFWRVITFSDKINILFLFESF